VSGEVEEGMVCEVDNGRFLIGDGSRVVDVEGIIVSERVSDLC